MLDDGLPRELTVPLGLLVGRPAPPGAAAVADVIETRRTEIARRRDTYRVVQQETPLGSARWPEEGAGAEPSVSLRWLATGASVSRRWGLFLHLCANALEARVVLELGAGVGISGAYLVSGGSVQRLVTLEASSPLARLAAATIRGVSDRASVVEGPFESELPRVLATLAGDGVQLDLAYVDGHHDEAATLQYVDALRPHLRPGALVVLDDIRLWRGMWLAWRRLASMHGVAAAIDTGRFGILVVGDGGAAPRRFDLARYTGWWRAGSSRRSRPASQCA
jgi:predicted O-methyltransferase YrrM